MYTVSGVWMIHVGAIQIKNTLGLKKVQGQSEAAVYVATRFDIRLRYIELQPNCYPFIPTLHLHEGSNMLNLFKVCAIFRIFKVHN